MARLIILGNGFDRNYKLPTDYKNNLRPILERTDSELFSKLDKLYFNGNIEYWSDFERKIGDVEDVQFLHDGLEEELTGLYMEDVSYYFPSDERYGDDFSAIENAKYAAENNRIDFKKRFIDTHLNDFDDFNCFIEEGFRLMAEEANAEAKNKSQTLQKDFNFYSDDYYLTFNYTSTLEILYPHIKPDHICHIHGSVQDDSDLVYGNINDNLYSGSSDFITENPNHDPDEGKDAELSNYREYIETVTYSEKELDEYNSFVIEKIEELNESMVKPIQEGILSEFLKQVNVDEVFIYGLSIGEVDIPYLEKINVLFPKSKWIISYFRSESDPVYQNSGKLSFSGKINLLESNDFKKYFK